MANNNENGNEFIKELKKERIRLIEKGIVIFIGVAFILVLIFVVGAKPCSANVLGISFQLPICDEENTPTTSPIAGTWWVSAGQGNSEVDISITIFDHCEAGNVCGVINLPTVPCQASLYIKDINGQHYDYDAIDHQGACGVPGVEYLELRSDGQLAYSYNGLSRILRRK